MEINLRTFHGLSIVIMIVSVRNHIVNFLYNVRNRVCVAQRGTYVRNRSFPVKKIKIIHLRSDLIRAYANIFWIVESIICILYHDLIVLYTRALHAKLVTVYFLGVMFTITSTYNNNMDIAIFIWPDDYHHNM